MKFLSSEKLSEHKYKTPEGYLICTDAILARTGKQTYRRSEVFSDSDDDSEIEVDRKAEEVFAPATLASFENKPITVEHPDENVTPDNYGSLSVGFVRDVRRGKTQDGQDVMLGTLVITDAQTIEEIENGEHTDLSCGYDCDIADEANPQQRNIRGNHVALCEQGRAGIARIVDSVKDSKIILKISPSYPLSNLQRKASALGINTILNKAESMKKEVIVEGNNFKINNLIEELDDLGVLIEYPKNFKDNNSSCKDSRFVIYNDDDEVMGRHSTLEAAKAAIKELKNQDKKYGNPFEEHYRIEIEDASCKDDIVFDYTEEDLAKAKEMFEKAEDETEKKLLKTLVDKIEFELMSRKQSDSKCKDDDLDSLRRMIRMEEPSNVRELREVYQTWCKREHHGRMDEHEFRKMKEEFGFNDSVKDTQEYRIAYYNSYSGRRTVNNYDANNVEDALKQFAKDMAIHAEGIANVDVISISPNDGYMRLYGRLDKLLKSMNINIYDSVKDDEEISTWKKKVEGAGTATSAILKTPSGYYFKSWHKAEDEYFKTLEEAERYAKSHGYIKDSIKDSDRYIVRKNSGAGEEVYRTDDLKDALEELKARGRSYYIDDTEEDKKITFGEALRFNNSIKDVEPREGESKEDFIARFMSETKEEYPDEKQRLAVANSYWERKNTKDSKKYTIRYKNKDSVYIKHVRGNSIMDVLKHIKK